MSQDKKNTSNKKNIKAPKFSFYWIYGIVLVLFIGYQFFDTANLSSRNLSQNEFKTILADFICSLPSIEAIKILSSEFITYQNDYMQLHFYEYRIGVDKATHLFFSWLRLWELLRPSTHLDPLRVAWVAFHIPLGGLGRVDTCNKWDQFNTANT